VILPDNLSPLPVCPKGDDPESPPVPFEDFVSAGDVRNVLLGGRAGLQVECLPADDFDSFAGRADVPYPRTAAFSQTGREPELRIPDMALEPRTIHPAFDVLPPSTRRVTPPRSERAVDCEASFGNSRLTDRWWIIGMGIAAAAVLFSGTLVDFISREAVRRSLSKADAPPEVIRAVQSEHSQKDDGTKRSLAASSTADEKE
jgi:hypothetical protein